MGTNQNEIPVNQELKIINLILESIKVINICLNKSELFDCIVTISRIHFLFRQLTWM
jgi:hypothetical protein